MTSSRDIPFVGIEIRPGHNLFEGIDNSSLIRGFMDNRSELAEDEQIAVAKSSERAIETKFINKFK